MSLILPKNYKSMLSSRETELAIKFIKDTFQRELKHNLNLQRISAPMFVDPRTGLNDNLSGVERPVSFDAPHACDGVLEIVHSLAKWKRYTLGKYEFNPGEGLYTDMNAIRRDEEVDNLHSIYVDQWDWELAINKEERTLDTLKDVVNKIYGAIRDTSVILCQNYPQLENPFPEQITFITTQELEDRYPNLTAKERENAVVKEYGAVFIMQIGGKLKSGNKHDGRAPDYDDWSLNGDILVYNKVLDNALELSSMGIRVDRDALLRQLKLENAENRLQFEFHKLLLEGVLPLTVGGGIGQSRLCMFLLQKAHVGEVQVSIWPEKEISKCKKLGINLL